MKKPIDVFKTRQVWKSFPKDFLEALSAKLESVEAAVAFADLCERTEILSANIAKVSLLDPPFALGSVTATLKSYANSMGQSARFAEAKRALDFALTFKPRYVPAFMSMALVAVNQGDCATAVAYADKVLTFRADSQSEDPWEAAQTKDANVVNEQINALMKQIKDACQGKQ